MSSSCARVELSPENAAMLLRRSSAKRAAGRWRWDSRNSLQRNLPNSSRAALLASKNSIGVQETAVTAGDANFHRGVGCFREEAKHQAVLFNFPDSFLGARSQHERRVTCSRITHQTVFQIDEKDKRLSNEVLFELAAEGEIQAGENTRGIVSVRSLTGESNF